MSILPRVETCFFMCSPLQKKTVSELSVTVSGTSLNVAIKLLRLLQNLILWWLRTESQNLWFWVQFYHSVHWQVIEPPFLYLQNLVSNSCGCAEIEWDNACEVLSTVLAAQYRVAATAAVVVTVLILIYHSTSRIRDGFTKKPGKFKLPGHSFCLAPFQCSVPYSVFKILHYCLEDTSPPAPASSGYCISSRPYRI